jgi:hypothetical protein
VVALGGGVLALVGYETQGGIVEITTGVVTFSAGALSKCVLAIYQQLRQPEFSRIGNEQEEENKE